MMFTGDLITGAQAAEWGLANIAVPAAELDAATDALADRIAGVPRSHLAMHKLVVNQVMLTAGLEQAQTLATVFDGITRHNPEGVWFRRQAQARRLQVGGRVARQRPADPGRRRGARAHRRARAAPRRREEGALRRDLAAPGARLIRARR